jgi:hypothetical protein
MPGLSPTGNAPEATATSRSASQVAVVRESLGDGVLGIGFEFRLFPGFEQEIEPIGRVRAGGYRSGENQAEFELGSRCDGNQFTRTVERGVRRNDARRKRTASATRAASAVKGQWRVGGESQYAWRRCASAGYVIGMFSWLLGQSR